MGKKILRNVVVAVLVVAAFLVAGCGLKASSYSEEQHIERVTKRVEKRYMNEESGYTGFEVFPLYDENEELKFFLVEFEPQGFLYVKLNETRKLFYGPGMYSRDTREGYFWRRYTVEVGIRPIPTITYLDGIIVEVPDRHWETDPNGHFIDYRDSHFEVAGIKDEKRYLIKIKALKTVSLDRGEGYVPCVKRGEKFLNLVSMEEMDLVLDPVAEQYAVSNIEFYPKSAYNL